MKAIKCLLAAALIAIPASAQLKLPAVSQHAVVSQTIGLTDITITYSRPGVKGRQIFGGLVPYGKVWRTGANQATQFAVTTDVDIEGKKLPAGTYSLHTIPGPDHWTVIFNKDAGQWGSFNYDEAKDALRVTVKPEKAAHSAEWLEFHFPKISTDSATLMIRWADVALPIKIDTNTTANVLANAKSAVAGAKADDWQTPYRAGTFALENGKMAEAKEWSDAAVKKNENLSTLWLRARVEQKEGHTAEAIKTADLALSKQSDKDNKDFVGEVKKQIAEWKK
jgi:tetratricopeptide (TPR) repeat protein